MIHTRNSTPTPSHEPPRAKRWTIRALSIALAGLLAACGGRGTEVHTQTPTVTQAPEVAPGVEADTPQAGGELRIYVPRNTSSLDPLRGSRVEVGAMLSLVYEKLIRLDGNLRLAPALAESWEPIDASGKAWKISLRKGATWQPTGEPFTAADVLYTYGLLKSEAYEYSPYAYHLDWIESLTALDDSTLMLRAVHPGAQALHALTFPVVSKRHFAYGKQPIGTGPYIMDKAERSIGFHFTVNSLWWRTPPHIESVTAICVNDSISALTDLQDGLLNYLPIRAATGASFREMGDVGVLQSRTRQSEALLINHANIALRDVNVRKAIAYAIDRKGIITKAYLGRAFATDVPISPSSWLYAAELASYDYNPELARDMLAQAGWVDLDADGVADKQTADGEFTTLKLTLLVNDTPESAYRKDVANQIRQDLLEIGIDASIVAARWSGEDDEYSPMLETHSFDLALAGFNMDPCPDLTDFVGTGGSRNYGQYSNAEMDALLDDFRSATAENDIVSRSRAVQQHFVDEVPYVHLYFVDASIVYNNHLKFPSDIMADINDESPYAGIEKWYFDAPGRQSFAPIDLELEAKWSQFDKNGVLEDVPEEGMEAGTSPSATPTATPSPTDDAAETDTQTEKPRSDTPRPTERASTPKPTQKPAEKPQSTPKPTQKPTPKPTKAPEEEPEDIPEEGGRPTKKPTKTPEPESKPKKTPQPESVPEERPTKAPLEPGEDQIL